jgi:hypothetical protein
VVAAARAMGIDLNMVDGGGDDRRPPLGVCRELWHACAGPVVSLPRRGSLVVYLPQGHLAAAGGGDVAADLPPHVVCRVADVELCVSAAGLCHLCGVFSSPFSFTGAAAVFGLMTMLAWLCAGGCGDGRGVRATGAGGGRRGKNLPKNQPIGVSNVPDLAAQVDFGMG